jgi:hypothetical protein
MILAIRPVLTLCLIAAFGLLTACAFPTRDQEVLNAVEAEARVLFRAHPGDAELRRENWPPAIATLSPEFVHINPRGIYITTKPYFDGGWGYFIPRLEGVLPEPVGRFEPVGSGVYWWHPY